MELQFPSSLILFSVFLFLLSLVFFKLLNPSKKPKLPPGPWKLPIIGNLHQLITGSLPHRTLRNLANKYGPIMHMKLGEVSTVIVTSPDGAREIMKTHDLTFAQRPYSMVSEIISYKFIDVVFAPMGSYWRQLRRICLMELLSPSRVKSFQPIREDEVMNVVKHVASCEGTPINFSEMVFSMTFEITSRTAFGKACKEKDIYIVNLKEIARNLSGFSIVDLYPSIKMLGWITGLKPKLEKLHTEQDLIIQAILNEHKEKMAKRGNSEGEAVEDLVDVLLRHQQHGDLEFPITDDTIKAVVWDVFSGGGETSSTIMVWVMSEILKSPKVMKKVQEEVRQIYGPKGNVDESSLHELKFLKAVIKETLRLHPTAPLLLPREANEDCEINGYEIPVKTKVLINAWAINRDPKYWPDAEKFCPERFLDNSIDFRGAHFEFITFGSGRRICPGITFALADMELPLAQLLFHFDWKLPNGQKPEDLDMTESFALAAGRKTDLKIIPICHSPLSAR